MFDPDAALAAVARYLLDRNLSLPQGRIEIRVAHGWITLAGDLDHGFQQRVAEDLIRQLPGVKGVNNQIAVPDASDSIDWASRPTPGDLAAHFA